MNPLPLLLAAVRRRLLGISPDELRYTIEDVRAEIRAVRAELKGELAEVRRQLDALPSKQDTPRGPEIPVAEA